MKLLPLLLSLSVEAGKKNKPGKEATECGCNINDVASNFIRDGNGTAECTKPGKKGSKGSTWQLRCENALAKSFTMGKKCQLKGYLSCDGASSDGDCKSLEALQAANPNATFACVTVNGKKETVSCEVDGQTNESTGKKKQLLKWATSAACTSEGGGGGEFTCGCEAEVANYVDIQCVADNTYSCMKIDGQVGTFSAKKCKKIAKKSKCAETAVTEAPVTEPPVTEPPVTEPPVTEPPVTEAPVTEAPPPPASDCTANADGTCGTPNSMESYVFVNFEGGTLNNQQVSNDPRLSVMDHISSTAYIAAGNGIHSFTSPRSQSVIARVDICSPLTQYETATNQEVGVPAGTPNCATDYTWAWKGEAAGFHNQFGYVVASPDGTYVLAVGVKETSLNVFARWIMKFDAANGAEIWSIIMPTDNSDGLSNHADYNQSGYESIAFTSDGGFVVGGWANHEGQFPNYKSGGQVEFGTPIFQKFTASVATQATPFVTPPTPEWTFQCDVVNCDAVVRGSMKTMRVFTDNGVEKVVSVPGGKATVIVVNVADGTKAAYKNWTGFGGSYQDIEPLIVGGVVTGWGVAGLDTSAVLANGTGGCIDPNGCKTIKGHISLLSADFATTTWSKVFNDWTGGTGAYAGLTPFSDAVVITECWSIAATKDANGATDGFVAACGQGIEGCRSYLTGVDEATLVKCEADPRITWRGAGVKVDLSGTMNWYRNDNERAYEWVDVDANGQIVFLSDKPIGFGFSSLVV